MPNVLFLALSYLHLVVKLQIFCVMNCIPKFYHRRSNFATAFQHDGEAVVQNGLALTPSDMDRMRMLGQPITTQQLQSVVYQNDCPDWNEPSPEFKRGVDMNDLYEARRSSVSKGRVARQHMAEIVEPKVVES